MIAPSHRVADNSIFRRWELVLQRAKPAHSRRGGTPARNNSLGSPTRDKNFVALTEKVFAILEAFSSNPQSPMTLEDITRSVGLAKTTTHRLLYSMKQIQYVEQNEATGLYMLSPKFFELGRTVLPYQRVVALAKPLLESLRLRCGESVHVAMLENGLITYIAVLESHNPYRCAAIQGECSYAHSTALGKCLLSYLTEQEIEAIIRQHGLPKLARNTITSGTQLLSELQKVRAEGVAVNNEENIDGVICCAAPIWDGRTPHPVAAVSVSGPAIRMDLILECIKQEIKGVTARISGMLGYAAART
jgi:DNA-binding IclR family transcriptional regulator